VILSRIVILKAVQDHIEY